ncbi:hypothetical protein CHELA40_11910 [Chelatococcus asaccharovorans]|nr:hypothetical protein CHELA40_11910 [Chelatococcus asaccharovorans]CAH1683817.1 hypothetical protein CHELA17_63689 [Chelatococcus asaccharovorans]
MNSPSACAALISAGRSAAGTGPWARAGPPAASAIVAPATASHIALRLETQSRMVMASPPWTVFVVERGSIRPLPRVSHARCRHQLGLGAAVADEIRAGDEGRVRARQKGDHRRLVLGLGDHPEGVAALAAVLAGRRRIGRDRRLGAAGRDRVAADAGRPPVAGKLLHQHDEGCLRRCVGAKRRRRLVRGDRRRGDKAAPGRRQHGIGGLAQQPGGARVDGKGALIFLEADFEQRAAGDDAGIADQGVEAAEGRFRGGDRRRRHGGICEIADEGPDRRALRRQFAGDLLERRCMDVDKHELGAAALAAGDIILQPEGGGAADAAGGTGNQDLHRLVSPNLSRPPESPNERRGFCMLRPPPGSHPGSGA